MLEFIAEALVAPVLEMLLALLGRLLKVALLLLLSPYLVLRGWLWAERQYLPLSELFQQGKQATASDVQYVLSVLVCLPLLALVVFGLRQGAVAVLAWLS